MIEQKRPVLGLPFPVLVVLALLAVPRAVLHDLGLVLEGTLVNMLLVFAPLVVWIAVAVVRRVPRPFLTLLAVGVLYGVFLALAHQLLWGAGWEEAPSLGGNLSDLPPLAQSFVIRGFSVVSSVVTGALVGALTGLVAWGLERVTRPRT